ncbi:MAG: CYTH domain-containing protein [Desulfamplus sp.]|nr:CYTH domain-containing protein [Desulfamplus sp.]
MGIEIERKFLVKDNSWLTSDIKCMSIKQGYLSREVQSAISNQSIVRIRVAGQKGFITIKGKTFNLSRLEYEYEIPVNDALEMLQLCKNPLIEKVRYKIDFMGFEWCIDKFEGDNEGLLIAEIELETEEQEFKKPSWAGKEVSDDPRYFNSNLSENPFQAW